MESGVERSETPGDRFTKFSKPRLGVTELRIAKVTK
jgi:hypothetical protein